MLAEDLTTKTEDELKKTLVDLKKQQMNLRFQKTNGQVSNTSQFLVIRKDVARVKTVLQEKKAGVNVSAKTKADTAKTAKKK